MLFEPNLPFLKNVNGEVGWNTLKKEEKMAEIITIL